MQKILQNKLGIKFVVVVFILVFLLIPIGMIESLITERSERQYGVEYEIAQTSSGVQIITGPFIYIEYKEQVLVDGKLTDELRYSVVLPELFSSASELKTYEKYRGIYKALLYRSANHISGQFDLLPLTKLEPQKIEKLNLVMAIEDIRGIGLGTKITLAGQEYTVEPGTQVKQMPEGVHIKLDYNQLALTQPTDYDISFELQGMKTLHIIPVGKESRVEIAADWPHPSFVGNYLPLESQISAQGFNAEWTTNAFSTNIAELFANCFSYSDCERLSGRTMGVSLVDPVNHYLKSHRAINYAMMIMVLVFASFFLIELFLAHAIHPVQYGFVGLALAVFYLLLISLSEHFGFALSYGVSALASTLLLGVYMAGVLKSTKQGGLFFVSIAVLYALLFGLLSAEDYALLMGSLLCFSVLSLVMLLTRKVDWYSKKNVDSDRKGDAKQN